MPSFSLPRMKRTDLAFDKMLRTNLIDTCDERSFSWARNTEPSKARKTSTTKASLGWGDLVDEDELVRDSPSLFQQGRIQRSNKRRTLTSHCKASPPSVRRGQTGQPSNKVYETFIVMSFLFSISSSTTVAVIAVAVAALGIQGGYNPGYSDIKLNRPTHIFSVRRNCHCYSLFRDARDGTVFGQSFFGALLLPQPL